MTAPKDKRKTIKGWVARPTKREPINLEFGEDRARSDFREIVTPDHEAAAIKHVAEHCGLKDWEQKTLLSWISQPPGQGHPALKLIWRLIRENYKGFDVPIYVERPPQGHDNDTRRRDIWVFKRQQEIVSKQPTPKGIESHPHYYGEIVTYIEEWLGHEPEDNSTYRKARDRGRNMCVAAILEHATDTSALEDWCDKFFDLAGISESSLAKIRVSGRSLLRSEKFGFLAPTDVSAVVLSDKPPEPESKSPVMR